MSRGSTLRETMVCSAMTMLRRRHHRIAGLVRRRAVAALALHGDGHRVGRGHERAGLEAELAHREARHVVQRKDGVAGEALEQPLLHHSPAAAQALLGRLEDEIERAVEAALLREVRGGGQQDGGVAVVAAGVHLAGHCGWRRAAPVASVDGQRVHVRTDAQSPVARAVPQAAHHAGAGQALVHLIAPASVKRSATSALVSNSSKASSGLAWIWCRTDTISAAMSRTLGSTCSAPAAWPMAKSHAPQSRKTHRRRSDGPRPSPLPVSALSFAE